MKVKELIAALQEYDEEMEVVVNSMDPDDPSLEKNIIPATTEVYDFDDEEVLPTSYNYGGSLREECEKKPIIKVLLIE